MEKLVHILPCEIIKDTRQTGMLLLEQIRQLREQSHQNLSDVVMVQLYSWIEKMLHRAQDDSVEGNYRYHWLLHDFPELYCQITNQYYAGPIKTLNKLKNETPNLYQLYAALLSSNKNISKLQMLYQLLKDSE